jgi:hypothetical protein
MDITVLFHSVLPIAYSYLYGISLIRRNNEMAILLMRYIMLISMLSLTIRQGTEYAVTRRVGVFAAAMIKTPK